MKILFNVLFLGIILAGSVLADGEYCLVNDDCWQYDPVIGDCYLLYCNTEIHECYTALAPEDWICKDSHYCTINEQCDAEGVCAKDDNYFDYRTSSNCPDDFGSPCRYCDGAHKDCVPKPGTDDMVCAYTFDKVDNYPAIWADYQCVLGVCDESTGKCGKIDTDLPLCGTCSRCDEAGMCNPGYYCVLETNYGCTISPYCIEVPEFTGETTRFGQAYHYSLCNCVDSPPGQQDNEVPEFSSKIAVIVLFAVLLIIFVVIKKYHKTSL